MRVVVTTRAAAHLRRRRSMKRRGRSARNPSRQARLRNVLHWTLQTETQNNIVVLGGEGLG